MSFITPSITTPIDVNTSIYFTAPLGYHSYSWGGAVTGSSNQSNTVSFTTPGTYTVTVLICDVSNCCGRYSYTFNVVNDCEGVSIATSYTTCSDITVTVTAGSGTKTYKVDGTYISIGVTALPISGIFTIDTSAIPPGESDNITITVFLDNGTEICSEVETIEYIKCACICDKSNDCQNLLEVTEIAGNIVNYTSPAGITSTLYVWFKIGGWPDKLTIVRSDNSNILLNTRQMGKNSILFAWGWINDVDGVYRNLALDDGLPNVPIGSSIVGLSGPTLEDCYASSFNGSIFPIVGGGVTAIRSNNYGALCTDVGVYITIPYSVHEGIPLIFTGTPFQINICGDPQGTSNDNLASFVVSCEPIVAADPNLSTCTI